VLPQLGHGVKRAPGVVEVGLPLLVQPPVIGSAECVERGGLAIARIAREKIRVGIFGFHMAWSTAFPRNGFRALAIFGHHAL
jgi:hypothetical protein